MLRYIARDYLSPSDITLLCRVLDKCKRQGDTTTDLENRAAHLLQLFQAGIKDEKSLIQAIGRSQH